MARIVTQAEIEVATPEDVQAVRSEMAAAVTGVLQQVQGLPTSGDLAIVETAVSTLAGECASIRDVLAALAARVDALEQQTEAAPDPPVEEPPAEEPPSEEPPPPVEEPPPPPPVEDPPPPIEGPNDFYNLAVATPHILRQRSLRSSDEVLAMRHLQLGHTSYDAGFDGAKIVLPAGVANYEQLRAGINVGAEFLGVEQVSALVMWDHLWTPSYAAEKGGLEGYKSFQLSRHNAKIYFEIRNRFEAQAALAGGLSYIDVRGYHPVTFRSGHTKGGANAIGPETGLNYGSDTIGPMEHEFLVMPDTLTRFFVTMTFTAGSTFASGVNVWVADEDRDPIRILRDVEMFWPATDNVSPGGLLHQWWLEFNSSQPRPAGEITMFARNFLVLRDVPDVNAWLRKPVRSA